MPEVRQELGLSLDAERLLVDQLERQRQETRDMVERSDPQKLFNLAPDEREQAMANLRKRIDESNATWDRRLNESLTAKQSARLNQLRMQRDPIAALTRPEIAKSLNLSEHQQTQLGKLQAALQAAPDRFGPPDFDRLEQQRRQTQAEAVALLSADQRTKWSELLGPAFAFPAEADFAGGRIFGPIGDRGFAGPGGPMGGERKLLSQFDKDGNGWLNAEERLAARSVAAPRGGERRDGGADRGPAPIGRPGRGPGPGFSRTEPGRPGPRVSPDDIEPVSAPLYDPAVLRTLFLEFENEDWEAELSAFHNTDVEVPATLIVDGRKYPLVGVHFRGMSSYMTVGSGSKRSLNLSLDLVDEDQRLDGYKTLNLLNSHEDATLMSAVLYSQIARQYLPAPKANFVKLVINGESWGIYANVQQFNKEFTNENFKSTKGARWKVSGSPGGGGGLEYLGDDVELYKRRYEIKSADNEKSWKALIKLCKTLNQTPPDQLEAALRPLLDIDGLLWFLALDVALVNNDGYWIRASDYNLYLDEQGKFHLIPHDMNEAFRPGGGPGFGGPGFGGPGFGGPGTGGPGIGGGPPRAGAGNPPRPNGPDGRTPPASNEPSPQGTNPARGPDRLRGPTPGGTIPGGPGFGEGRGEVDPLIGLNDASKPLRSKILVVPSLREKYLENVRAIARDWLDWRKLGPVVSGYRRLIAEEVQADTRKLESYEAFLELTADDPPAGRRGRQLPLRTFADQRRKYLLDYQPQQ